MTKNKTPPSEIDRLRHRAETQLQEQLTQAGQPPPTAAETLRLVNELQVNQIELELQNHALLEMRAELEQRVEKYADLYDFAPLGYFTLAADGTIQEINLAGAALLGQDRSYLIGRRFGLFVSAATQFTFNAFLAATLIGTSRQTCEVVLDPAGLPPRFMRLEGIGAVSGTSQQCRIAAIDITERKQAEAALQQSEIFVKDILDSLSAHIAVLDTQGTITLVNAPWRRFAEQNGGNVSCQVGANYLEVCRQVLAGDDRAEAQAALQGIHKIISGAQICFKLEYPCDSPTESRWFAMSVFHLSGTRQGVVIAHEDITERKQAEQTLRQYQYMVSAMTDSVALVDQNYIYQVVNEEYLRRSGKKYDAIVGHSVADVLGEEVFQNLIKEKLDRCLAGDTFRFQEWLDFQKKGRLFLDVTFSPYCDEQGARSGIVVSTRDITAVKLAEQAWQVSKARFRALVELLPYGVQESDLTGRVTFANAALERLHGRCEEGVVGRFIWDFLADDTERGSLRDYLQFLVREQPPPTTYFSKDRHTNGSVIDCQIDWTYLYDAHGQVRGFLSVITDITQRKQTEEALRLSAANLLALIENTDDFVVSRNRDGRVIVFNSLFAQIVRELFGIEATPGIRTTDYMPEMQKAYWENIFSQVLAGKKHREEFTWSLGGNTYYYEISLNPIRVQNEIIGFTEFTRDITERKRVEQALRDSLAEKETLLCEVHHRVKNNLAAMISLLELQRAMQIDVAALSLLNELSGRVKAMSLVHEMLYHSDTLNRIDFHAYLQALIEYLRRSFDLHDAIRIDVAATGVWMSLDTAIPCGLIVNELVINALKYAFPEHQPRPGANTCHIDITVTWADSAYTLIVADNGVGLPADLDWTTTKTLGLRLVRMLGQHQLQGTLELGRTGGTCVALRFGARHQNRSVMS